MTEFGVNIWATMRKYINTSFIHLPSEIYTTRLKLQFCSMAVLETGSELLLGFDKDAYSPQLSSRIISDTLEDHKGTQYWGSDLHYFSLRRWNIVNAEEEEEADDIVTIMDATCTGYKMAIAPDKTKKMTNSPGGFQREQDKRPNARRDEELQISGISHF